MGLPNACIIAVIWCRMWEVSAVVAMSYIVPPTIRSTFDVTWSADALASMASEPWAQRWLQSWFRYQDRGLRNQNQVEGT